MAKDDLKSRFQKMELHLAYLAGAASVILGFLGWTYFHTIPTAIEDKIGERIGDEAEKKIDEALEKAKTILKASDLQDKVLKNEEEVVKTNEAIVNINEEIVKINESRLCEETEQECVCKIDGGTNKAMLLVCVSRCPDGRLRGIEIKKHVSTTKPQQLPSCGDYKSKESWE